MAQNSICKFVEVEVNDIPDGELCKSLCANDEAHQKTVCWRWKIAKTVTTEAS